MATLAIFRPPDDALKSWQAMYDAATTSSSTLARAGSARHLADLYKTKKEFAKSIDYYALAAEASASAGNEQSRIEALTSEWSLLFQQGEKEKALKIDEELLPLARTSKNVRLQFLVNRTIAEILDGTGRADRVESALKDAESLVGPDVSVPGKRSPVAVATGDKVQNHSSALSLGSFPWYWLVFLALVGTRFTGKRKIWGVRPLYIFPFSPPAEGRGQCAKDDY